MSDGKKLNCETDIAAAVDVMRSTAEGIRISFYTDKSSDLTAFQVAYIQPEKDLRALLQVTVHGTNNSDKSSFTRLYDKLAEDLEEVLLQASPKGNT